jgi:hypothetical protein
MPYTRPGYDCGSTVDGDDCYRGTLTTSSLPPALGDLDRQFAAAKAEATELVHGLEESQFNWRPDRHSWSMSECLLHLNMVGDRCVQMLESTLTDARARGRVGHGPVGYGWLGKWIIAHTEPPSKHKYKAPRAFTPVCGQPITAVLPTFGHLQEQLSQQLEGMPADWIWRTSKCAHLRRGCSDSICSLSSLGSPPTSGGICGRRDRVRNHAAFPAVR